MPRQRKPKPEAVILPPEYDDIDEDAGSAMPDDDGWVTLEEKNGTVAEGNGNPVTGTGNGKQRGRVAGKTSRRRPRNAD